MPYKNKEDEKAFRKRNYLKNKEKLTASSNRWRMKNLDRVRIRQRFYKCRNVWGIDITYEELVDLIERGKKTCDICGMDNKEHLKDKTHTMGFAIDHCHTKKIIRGILCFNCNSAIGLFKENTTVMRNAIKYLEKYK